MDCSLGLVEKIMTFAQSADLLIYIRTTTVCIICFTHTSTACLLVHTQDFSKGGSKVEQYFYS